MLSEIQDLKTQDKREEEDMKMKATVFILCLEVLGLVSSLELRIPHVAAFEKGFVEGEGGAEGLRGVAVFGELEVFPEEIAVGWIDAVLDDE